MFVVACLGGSQCGGHGLTWPAIFFRQYYTSAQPHAEPSKVSQPTGGPEGQFPTLSRGDEN